jgi:hypothetical protein
LGGEHRAHGIQRARGDSLDRCSRDAARRALDEPPFAPVQRQDFREERDAELRAKRADVYAEFLDAASGYADEVTLVFRRCGPRSRTRCNARAFSDARRGFQEAINAVHIYGSRRAVKAQRQVSGALPPSLGSYAAGAELVLFPVEEPGFSDAYNEFLDLMRSEVVPTNRPPRATD